MTREERLRYRLDNWKLWVGIAYFGLIFVIMALFFLNRDISQAQADRAAEQKSSQIAQVQTCRQRAQTGPDVQAIITLVRLNAENTIAAAKAAIATDPDGPLTEVRLASIARSERNLDRMTRFQQAISEQTPTLDECNALAKKLGVQSTVEEE